MSWGNVRLAVLSGNGCSVLPQSRAQINTQVVLPAIDVGSSRLGSVIVGASTSSITAEDIGHSPAQNLPDILAQQAGIQTQHLFSATNGSLDGVDLRGFGVFAPSNVLILVNGRRFQDFDLQGFDFSSIPLNSIERIEITRGNSGTVLYGDGAIGGVINIVTKKGSATRREQSRRGVCRLVTTTVKAARRRRCRGPLVDCGFR